MNNERIYILARTDEYGGEIIAQAGDRRILHRVPREIAEGLMQREAAVAELIAGMRQVLIEATESPNSDRMRLEVIEELARAALARVGGAS